MYRIIGEILPPYVFLENSPMLVSRGLARILGDLAAMGYDAKWGCIAAYQTGFETNGERLWLVAKTIMDGSQILCPDKETGYYTEDAEKNSCELDATSNRIKRLEKSLGECSLCGTSDEVAQRLDRFKAIGNGQDPFMAKAAWDILSDES